MVIEWQAGEYVHLQGYHGVGFVLNWPGTSSFGVVEYLEKIVATVIICEALSYPVTISETSFADVIITESLKKERTI